MEKQIESKKLKYRITFIFYKKEVPVDIVSHVYEFGSPLDFATELACFGAMNSPAAVTPLVESCYKHRVRTLVQALGSSFFDDKGCRKNDVFAIIWKIEPME